MKPEDHPIRAAGRREADRGRKLKTVPAGNGLAVDIYDRSRPVAGDRWLVSVLFRMDVPVTSALEGPGDALPAAADVIRSALGERVTFEQKRERVFVDENSKDLLVEAFVETFLRETLPYLSRPAFARRCVLRTYAEHKQRHERRSG